MHEGRRGRKWRRRGHRGPCSYCAAMGKDVVHKRGKRGDSCRGHGTGHHTKEGR